MQVVLAVLILSSMGVIGIAWFKLMQFKHPKAALWYYMGAYCIANGDAEMRRIERQTEHYRAMEDLCGGKIERSKYDRQTQNS
jgi:Tfp pilus assembly protein PilV